MRWLPAVIFVVVVACASCGTHVSPATPPAAAPRLVFSEQLPADTQICVRAPLGWTTALSCTTLEDLRRYVRAQRAVRFTP